MKRLTLKEIFKLEPDGRDLVVKGWVRTKRETKAAVFLELNDGSRLANMQCVFEVPQPGSDLAAALAKTGTGASVAVEGKLVASPASGQKVEIKARGLTVIG